MLDFKKICISKPVKLQIWKSGEQSLNQFASTLLKRAFLRVVFARVNFDFTMRKKGVFNENF